jgi:serine/threonine protein kinase
MPRQLLSNASRPESDDADGAYFVCLADNLQQQYKLLPEKIGEGAYKTVWACKNTAAGSGYALCVMQVKERSKILWPDADERKAKEAEDIVNLFAEVQLMKKLKQPNIMQVIDYGWINGKFVVITERMECDLAVKSRNMSKNSTLTYTVLNDWAKQILLVYEGVERQRSQLRVPMHIYAVC